MFPKINTVPLSLHPLSLCRSSLLAAALAAVPGLAQAADTADTGVSNVVPQQLVVGSNGSSYHSVSTFANLGADVRIEIDTGVVGRVKSWKLWLGLGTEDGAFEGWPHHNVSKSYPWYDRPRRVNRTVQVLVPSVAWGGFVKARCNALADDLRAQGLGNTAIFSEDRKIELAVYAPYEADTSGAGSDWVVQEAEGWALQTKIDLVCKKWAGATVPQAGNGIAIEPPKVVSHDLSIVEQYGPSGLCKIRLDGSITTDRTHADVSFRYRNEEGKLSQVWTVNTGASKTASFSHSYDIPNSEWAEIGGVRMVGVSHDFESEMVTYTMDCVEGGPEALTANLPPKLTMTFVEEGKVMVAGHICPERLKLVGLMEGRGGFSGQAGFVARNGRPWFSAPQDFSIAPGDKVLIGATYELDWSQVLVASGKPVDRERRFDFNVITSGDTVLASLKNRRHLVGCTPPQRNPAVGANPGGLTIEPRQPAAPTVQPRMRQQQQTQPPVTTQPGRMQVVPRRQAN